MAVVAGNGEGGFAVGHRQAGRCRQHLRQPHAVNLTVLALDIVEAILEDKLPPDTKLFDLAVDPPALWDDQRRRIGLSVA